MADGIGIDPQLNAWWLDRTSPNDAAAHAAFSLGVQVQQNKLANQLKLLDLMDQQERTKIAAKTYQTKLLTERLKAVGLSELTDFVSKATADGKLTDPKTHSDFWKLTSKIAPFADENMVIGVWQNTFQAAVKRQDEAKKLELEKPTADIKNVDTLFTYQKALNEAVAAGNKAKEDEYKFKFEELSKQMGPKGMALELIPDESGHYAIRMAQGGAQLPTLAVQTETQKQSLAGETAVSTGVGLLDVLTPQNVGVQGVFNEEIRNKLLAGVFPGAYKEDVSGPRNVLRIFRERFLKGIKADAQISAIERRALEEAAPSPGAIESVQSANDKIKSILTEYKRAERISAERTNRPIRDWAWTKEEIAAKFKAGEINEERARYLLKNYNWR